MQLGVAVQVSAELCALGRVHTTRASPVEDVALWAEAPRSSVHQRDIPHGGCSESNSGFLQPRGSQAPWLEWLGNLKGQTHPNPKREAQGALCCLFSQ